MTARGMVKLMLELGLVVGGCIYFRWENTLADCSADIYLEPFLLRRWE